MEMKARKILMTAICLFLFCLCLKAQICNTPAPPPPEWIFNPTTRASGMTPPYTMRVFVHVVRSSSGVGLGSNIVTAMLSKLNKDYAGTQIDFQSAGSDFIDDNTFYNQLDTTEYSSLYSTNSQPNAIDIYVLGTSTVTGGYLGMAQSIPSTALWIHGSVYNTSVLSHEMGHCLGLYHTHHGTVFEPGDLNQCSELVNGSNSSTCGDYINDTAADPNLWNGCKYNGGNKTDANGQKYNPNSANYMAYSDYTCWTTFTSMQKQRMLDFIGNTMILKEAVIPRIGGPSNVCPGSTTTFTLNNAPTVAYTWGKSNSLQGSGPTFTASTTPDDAWVSINIGNHELVRFNFVIGIATISGSTSYFGFPASAMYYAATSCPTTSNYTWKLSITSHQMGYPQYWYNSNYAPIEAVSVYNGVNQDVHYLLEILAGNTTIASKAIGAGAGIELYLGGAPYKSPVKKAEIYPNPTSGALYIELGNSSGSKTQDTFDVRLLDAQGNLLRQTFTKGGTVEFNVADLPIGFYYLHVYNGVDSNPEVHQIMVE